MPQTIFDGYAVGPCIAIQLKPMVGLSPEVVDTPFVGNAAKHVSSVGLG